MLITYCVVIVLFAKAGKVTSSLAALNTFDEMVLILNDGLISTAITFF